MPWSGVKSRSRRRCFRTDASGKASAREVWPLALYFWGGTWTVGAWCESRGDFRNFRVDRSEELAALERHRGSTALSPLRYPHARESCGLMLFWTVQSRTMARPREFDADDALERATRLFWSKGFEQTSLDDLCAATGLGRSSLYAAFGDKRALYLKALARYEERSVARIAKAFDGRPLRRGLEAFLAALIDEVVAGPGRSGCFIGNCAAELARLDASAAARVRRSLERIEAAFKAVLARELAPGARVDALARFLTAGVQGLRLVGKTNPGRAALEDIAWVMLRCLESKEN